ncbi:metalloregulator ArsR/SmtB family transcription factor [Thermococcus sp.]|uniref:winged helix-turn-helix transcriptional regulator n=1 Tax=Thermococcus sp. TaxID=35749 RepID=UPI0026291E10|nr:metalloregulator ArsR/SmtB family transcription factor [Thermococcus sp.]
MERRDEILGTIQHEPGITFRGLARRLGLGIGDLQYHLRKLERDGEVFSRRVGRRRYLFPKGLEDEAQRLLIAISTDTRRRILLRLIEGPADQKTLSEYLGVSQPTVSYHMGELVKLGIIEAERRGKSVVYRLSYDPGLVVRMIRDYRPGLLERLADGLIDLLAGVGGGDD